MVRLFVHLLTATSIECEEFYLLTLVIFLLEDVLALTGLLQKYHNQLEVIEKLEDAQQMGVFRMNNRVLRENAYPTVVRCIEVLHEVVPV